MNSCHPQDIESPLKAPDLRFGLLHRAGRQPSRHLNTSGFTAGSITANITGRLSRPALAMPAYEKGRAAAVVTHRDGARHPTL